MTIEQDFDVVPVNEDCSGDCITQRKYATILRRQLKRIFGVPPEGVRYKVCFNDHDFGGYITLKLIVPETEEGLEYFHKIDSEFPQEWDEEALNEIMETEF